MERRDGRAEALSRGGAATGLGWIAWVEAAALIAMVLGWWLEAPGVLWAGGAVMLVATLAFAPLIALARLERREDDRSRNANARPEGRR